MSVKALMNEKQKIILTVLVGLAVLFFVFTNFCLSLMRDTSERVKEYNQLKAEVETLTGANEKNLDTMQKKLKALISQLEDKFSSREKFKFVQQMTTSAKTLNIIFTDIDRKDPQQKDGYEEFPVDVSMTASFKDFVRYLLAIEQNPKLIGIRSLSLRKSQRKSPILDIKATFSGFNLLRKPTPVEANQENRYAPIDNKRLDKLLEPLVSRDNQDVILQLADADPFTSEYDLKKPVPTIQTGSPAADPSMVINGLFLEGIIQVHNQKAALINDAIVKEKEMISGAEVVSIQDDKVILRYLDKDYTLTVGVTNVFIH